MEYFTTRPTLAGTFGAVGSTHWIASAVAMKLLEAGGNAFDASVAAGFALQIVEPHLNGPAGDAPILLSRHDDPEPTVICGQGGAPAAATLQHFRALDLELIPGTGLLAACIPGAFGAWLTMLRDWGTVSLRTALQPAIDYAVGGHPILSNTVATIQSVQKLFLEEWTTSAAVFLPDGAVPVAGSLFSNSVLGALYEKIVAHSEAAGGSREKRIDAALEYWYEGPVAAEVDRFIRTSEVLDISGRRHRGLLTAQDMQGWRPAIERAVSVDYRDYKVFKCGPWSQGPTLLQALRLLEGYDIGSLNDEGPEFVHIVTETLKLAMADRDAWYGDDPAVPIDALLSRQYAAERRTLIDAKASLELRPGMPAGRAPVMPHVVPVHESKVGMTAGGGEPTFARETQPVGAGAAPAEGVIGDTCHLDVIDRWGNMVSATPSGGWLQSSPVIPAAGLTPLMLFYTSLLSIAFESPEAIDDSVQLDEIEC
jgi:gamma-glutamyltranspeptidase / glutathione hydrolase